MLRFRLFFADPERCGVCRRRAAGGCFAGYTARGRRIFWEPADGTEQSNDRGF